MLITSLRSLTSRSVGKINDGLRAQDESNPDFVAEVVELYFEDSAGKLEKLDQKLAAQVPDFNEVDQLVHQFKGSSASFGAQSLAARCVQVPLALAVPEQPPPFLWIHPCIEPHCSRRPLSYCSDCLIAGHRILSYLYLCLQLRDACMRGDKHGCQALLQEVKTSFGILKGKLEIFMQLETQRKQLLGSSC